MQDRSSSSDVDVVRIGPIREKEIHGVQLGPSRGPVEGRSALSIGSVNCVRVLVELADERFTGQTEDYAMNKREVLLLNPVVFAVLGDASETLDLLVVTLSAEDEVPNVVVGTARMVSFILCCVLGSLHLVDVSALVDEELNCFVLMHPAIKCPLTRLW